MDPLNTPKDETALVTAAVPAKPARRWLRVAALAGGSFVVLAVVALGTLWWWAGMDGSLATTLRWIGQSQPLTAERATGSLRSRGQIDQLVWQQDGLRIDARDVSLSWQPWSLLHGTLKLNRLSAASVQVDDQRAPAAAPPTGPPAALSLPLPIVLDAFSVGQLRWTGPTTLTAFTASGISGRYEFNGLQHQLDLLSAQVASGHYSGRAVLSSRSPLMLDASLSGALAAALPDSKTSVPLAFQATVRGPLKELLVNAELQMTAKPAAGRAQPQQQPHASATARITPWAAQPLPQADANFHDLDIAGLWPDAPQTLLSGSASVRPLDRTAAAPSAAWLLQLQLANHLPGPWDQHRLPLERLETQGEWRNGAGIVRTLKAQLGGGELLANGEWTGAPPAKPSATDTAAPAQAWKLQATLQHVNPALLHTQLAPLPIDGRAAVRNQGTATDFEASVQAASSGGSARSTGNKAPASRTPSSENTSLGQLRLRDASATGSWNPRQAGGTLVLSALRVRTDEAELSGQLEVQPAARGGKGKLALTAPGLDAKLQGELRQTSGGGTLSLRGRDAAQALRWLQKLPGLPATIQTASASGSAELQASWQGGWLDPALQARLELPSLDWRTAGPISAAPSPATATPGVLKIRALQASLSGRLSQAQFSAQGRMEVDQRRYALQLAAVGGRVRQAAARNAALGESAWQGLLKQLSVSVEDPALGAGAWRLATRAAVPLKWTPTRAGGAFESGAGEALLSAPSASASATAPSQATLTWQPIRWRPGELFTAGKLTGLPMAWIELLGGPQMAGAGLAGNLVFEGEWDARLSDTLALKASLTRSSGDITVQADTAQGTSTRVAAGVRQARVSLVSEGEALTLAVRWDSERAGTADGRLLTRLARAPSGTGLGGWLWPADAALNGQLHAQLPRIGVWSMLAPPGWRLRGSLGADVAIGGTRAAPQLTGDLQANDLALRSIVDGIEFGNGRLRARLDGTRMRINEFSLQGAGDKGTGGLLTAQGEAGWIEGRPQVQLSAKLERLHASLRTDRQVTVSGEVQASLKGDQTELTGKLVIDQARIILPDEGTPQLGDDVLVRTTRGAAAGQKAPAQTSAPTSDKEVRPIKLAVQIDLGRDFRIQGKGLDTRVRGTLALYGDSLREPRLTGTVNTAGGQYRAYGQRLDVEQGVLRFTGPVDNPTLDILAIRPNLTQRVGVQITGTALLPRVRLYAQPELPDAEKLSWLVIGRPSAAGGAEAALLQQAALALLGSKSGGISGGLAASLGLDELSFRGASSNADGSTTEGAVTLGRRFSRNFYAAYERSISGALGTLYVFYDLSQRFTVRAQAGQQSAVDLIFTVPYD
ncbi:translocation/assembly module TamB domain-containing protein [Polaromonas sp. UBA4122]|uniref:translocation/assembly module TamB domain-containing protein n=1 Tax=Polaromonas sp. UBA4122 TaxID=1947074 RepID=UPI0025E19D98|nr:translocation/assembly module TamB domain-containing protein [Polaromonas sp. UBA4122]